MSLCANFMSSDKFYLYLKSSAMRNILYIVAVILLIGWAIGFFAYSLGSVIHILLVIAVIVILLNIIQGRRA